MISDKMAAALNNQINKEIFSAYLYLGMSSYAFSKGLSGMANWFSVQVKEELTHAQKFFDYLNHQGAKVSLFAVDAPDQKFSSPADLFKKTIEHEKKVTALINELSFLANAEKDRATDIFLQWFVTEQVEEEAAALDIYQKLNLVGDNGHGILLIDGELAKRTFIQTAATVSLT
ncbi:ferroxidase [Candidatus Omnitrophus magneticus]|uniref:Ferritin n=1 Tax=Candidatus Omnitrophus magneticus TaxID=1609969 RepID=A0A0F0CWI4_9BACT|nr:ferroxidase [Candidatus Omnitrophus magneticus]